MVAKIRPAAPPADAGANASTSAKPGNKPSKRRRPFARTAGELLDAVVRPQNAPLTNEVAWSPKGNPAQFALLQCPVFEVFFGGARGGGKTDGMMIRRTRAELVDTIERSRMIYGVLGWKFNETEKMWRATNGARLRFAYLERDADANLYIGHSYTRVYIEEISNFPSPAPLLKLMATLRSGDGVPVGLRATGNPGGPGHHWVKQRYVDPAPMGNCIITDPVTELKRVFIPSKVDNNAHIDIASYKQRLRASGSAELVRAWLDGDWSVTLGAFFDCWEHNKHVVTPFEVPKQWMRFRAMDWGSAVPFCVQWFAVVQDNFEVCQSDGEKRILPRGCLVCYREWYGMQPGQPNVGVKFTAHAVGLGIAAREKNEEIAYGVLDPSAFTQDGGPSIAERMLTANSNNGNGHIGDVTSTRVVTFRRADNARVAGSGAIGGWDQMRARLIGDDDGRPMLVFFSTCTESIRTIPVLQHDPDRHEDVMTDSEDHASDCCRYACMSRPYVPTLEKEPQNKTVGYVPLYGDDVVPGNWLAY